MRMHCEVWPYFNIIGHNDFLLEMLNLSGEVRCKSVSNVMITKAHLNLDVIGQASRLNNDDIDPRYQYVDLQRSVD